MKHNRWIALGLTLLMALSLAACGQPEAAQESPTAETAEASDDAAAPDESPEPEAPTPAPVRVLSLKGPTGMGLAGMMKKHQDDSDATYQFELVSAPDEVVAALTSGTADIAAVPSNLAATLYNKTSGDIQVLAVNALSNLYVLSDDESIQSIADLAGKTLHATGQGASPEYVLNELLAANGVVDCTIEWHAEHSELATLMASGDVTLGLLPEPFVEVALAKNEALASRIDINAEWNVQRPGSPLPMGTMVVRKAFAAEQPEVVDQFLEEYRQSVADVNANPEEAGMWIAELGIFDNAAIATLAIPKCNMVFLREASDDAPGMIEILMKYYRVLFDANPKSIGGAMPESDFFYGMEIEAEEQLAALTAEEATTVAETSPEGVVESEAPAA